MAPTRGFTCRSGPGPATTISDWTESGRSTSTMRTASSARRGTLGLRRERARPRSPRPEALGEQRVEVDAAQVAGDDQGGADRADMGRVEGPDILAGQTGDGLRRPGGRSRGPLVGMEEGRREFAGGPGVGRRRAPARSRQGGCGRAGAPALPGNSGAQSPRPSRREHPGEARGGGVGDIDMQTAIAQVGTTPPLRLLQGVRGTPRCHAQA